MNINDFSVVNSIVASLPSKIWRFDRIRGSLLLIDSGEKIKYHETEERTFYMGSFSLTIYLCEWQLYKAQKVVLTSDDTLENKYNQLGQQITNLDILSIIETVPRRKIIINLQNDFRFVLHENIKVYGYQAPMLSGFINQASWLYSPTKRFHWEKNKS